LSVLRYRLVLTPMGAHRALSASITPQGVIFIHGFEPLHMQPWQVSTPHGSTTRPLAWQNYSA
jgi:hypothetical protein